MAAGERAPARRRLRASAEVISTLMTSILGLAVFGTLSGFFLSNYFLSNYTQHHGIPDSGTISNVSNTRSDRGSWSATVQITLDRPVDGATSTTLAVGNEVNSPDGTSVTVLVDPQDPAHAEYPGGTDLLQVSIMFLCFTGVSALLLIFVVWRLAVIRFRNRGLPPPAAGRHRDQRGTRARSRVGGLPAIGDRGAGPDAVGGGAAADGRMVPRQWVVAPEAGERVAALAEMVARSAQASLVLGQVLRATETLPVLAALDVESFAYSMLLGGKEFGHWLSGNEDREPPPLVDEPVLVKREERANIGAHRSRPIWPGASETLARRGRGHRRQRYRCPA